MSLSLFGLFFTFLVGLSIAGFLQANEDLLEHHQSSISFLSYLVSPEFGEAVFENFESEFLQMGALVVLTIWLVQKGSADSKKLRGQNDVDLSSRYSIIHATTRRTRVRAVKRALYDNSLSLVLFGLFLVSFILHALTGVAAANEEALWHGEQSMNLWQYMSSAQFWFESFQNWQSEFLAVGMLIVLSIFLRQRKSPESKPIGQANSKTGS